jgi:hypothetical protein
MLKEENKIQVSKSSSQLLWSSWKRCNAHMNWKSQFGEFSMGLTNVNSISSTTIICFYFMVYAKDRWPSLSHFPVVDIIFKVFFI